MHSVINILTYLFIFEFFNYLLHYVAHQIMNKILFSVLNYRLSEARDEKHLRITIEHY